MSVEVTEEQVLATLQQGEMAEKGVLPYSSNHSFLVVVEHEELALPAVYKPRRGETPLWDFARGTLCRRERAAYVVSRALGWRLVPPTVLRSGTRGLGSVQFFVDHDSDSHYFSAAEDARFTDSFRQLALFDFVINNADRKSGHCLVGNDGRVWAIDHGICFHADYKLRTVLWEFSDTPIEATYQVDLAELDAELREGELAEQLAGLLAQEEVNALQQRVVQLLQTGRYPAPSEFRRNYPWPPI
ncbi:MAG: SCO1664 family protein [Caldilinea sp.]|jgi:hypothetical protein